MPSKKSNSQKTLIKHPTSRNETQSQGTENTLYDTVEITRDFSKKTFPIEIPKHKLNSILMIGQRE